MMSLKPRNVDFQETWASLKETVAGVVGLRTVDRAVWNTRFSDVYALCVAHPEPLADRLYDETRGFLEEHVSGILRQVAGGAPDTLHERPDPADGLLARGFLEEHVSGILRQVAGGAPDTLHERPDPADGLLARYVSAWREYSQGAAYLNCLYSYLNLQHVKRQKVSDAEIIYGSAATVSCTDNDSRQLEVGELALEIWERVLVAPLAGALSARVVRALCDARDHSVDAALADTVRAAIHSTVHVRSFRVRNPLALYQRLVLEPYLEAASAQHALQAAAWLQREDISQYMQRAITVLELEQTLARRFLHSSSVESARAGCERELVGAHLATLHAEVPRLLRGAAREHETQAARRLDLRRLYRLLAPLGAAALRPLVAAAHAQVAGEGRAAEYGTEEPHVRFVESVLALHTKYSELFADVFTGAQAFVGALDKACSEVVNARRAPDQPARAPELLARYCDCLLRKRSGGGCEADTEERLTAAITVFKYVDDKDVFQKYYARALARRLIHQLSASMEQEEAMINRLKAACGYEFTNKLHRMFTDVALSADLNAKFQQHLRDHNHTLPAGFNIQVLQAGAWPLGGAMAPLAPPLQLEKPARLFEAFYRAAFSGRRLAWLHHLCTGELRTRYTPRLYHVTATTHQCALLLCFESVDSAPAREVRDTLQLAGEAWPRHLRPLLEAGLLTAQGEVEAEGDACDGSLHLNLAFSCKRTKVRLTCATATNQPGSGQAGGGGAGAAEGEATHCDDDRKMYLQAAIVRIMKQRKVLRHTELIQEVVTQARGSFAPSVAMIKKCIEALIDKQYLERTSAALDTYSYLA